MKITSIPNIYRNVNRWRKILTVLSRYGLADWLSNLNIDLLGEEIRNDNGESLGKHTRESRIRRALTDLGSTFIKLGQLLSTRPDVVGNALAEELKQLQTDVPADDPETIRELVEVELGQPIQDLFVEFEDRPIASASIGQVHRATLLNGERVVVKVQHANIESTVKEDLDILAGLAQLAEQLDDFKPYRPTKMVAEVARMLRRELDFGREERNLQQFNALFADNPTVRIPQPYSELCTPRVLTMELIEGVKLSSPDHIQEAGFDVEAVARRGAELYLEMIFKHGFYHADPHPGNIQLLPGNIIGLLDFGMVGRIEERLREDIEEMLLAIVNRDVLMLTTIVKRIGEAPAELDEGALSTDIADFVGQYATTSLDDFDLSSALNDMVEIMFRHRISLPPQVSLLIKTLVTLDGTARMLSPKFSLLELMQPFHRTMAMRRMSPTRQLRKMRRLYMELEHLAEVLPSRLLDIMGQLQTGKFEVQLDHRGLEPSVNRLVLGLLCSAMFLGSSVMLSMKVPPLLFPQFLARFGMDELSIVGLAGIVFSLLLGIRLFRAIGKSGHLD
ncbi:MAG: ABC transporter [Blastopirellula sp.]|nr:ABC transporter [Blastopirellula sp.]